MVSPPTHMLVPVCAQTPLLIRVMPHVRRAIDERTFNNYVYVCWNVRARVYVYVCVCVTGLIHGTKCPSLTFE